MKKTNPGVELPDMPINVAYRSDGSGTTFVFTKHLATISKDFDPLLGALLDQKALMAFADKYSFHLSKRLIDAEISQIPAAKGLNGQFNEQAYQQFLQTQHLTDPQVRGRFRHFVNSDAQDTNVVFIEERGQMRPATLEEKQQRVIPIKAA